MRELRILILCATALSVLWVETTSLAKEPQEFFELWPKGHAPGNSDVDASEDEQLVTDRRRTFRQYTNISTPKVAVFPADEQKRTGAAVLVLPGGGMQRLAYEHEGVEIADWLNPQGIAVFVLKYRVPGPSTTALLDAQRAMGLIRQRAREFQIDTDRIGTMGFSAGGEVALLLATNYSERGYEAMDAADEFSCQPKNACLVYPGGIASRSGELRGDIATKLNANSTPEMFIVHSFPDASLNSLALGLELKLKRVPFEMHIYQEGGHGFGARESALPLSGWKDSYLHWIASQGFLDPPFVSEYARALAEFRSGAADRVDLLSTAHPTATVENAYAIQRKVVATQRISDPIVGYSAVALSDNESAPENAPQFATGVLFKSGKISVAGSTSLSLAELGQVEVAMKLGFVVSNGLDISTRIANVDQIRGAFETVVPVIDLPWSLQGRLGGNLQEVDMVAANLGSARFLHGSTGVPVDDFEPATLRLTVQRDGQDMQLNSRANSELWSNLIQVVNRIVDQGYTLRSGNIVVLDGFSQSFEAASGNYQADFSQLGRVMFSIN